MFSCAGWQNLGNSFCFFFPFRQQLANFAVYVARHFFDGITSYNLESMTERKWLRRILFLETVAGKALLALEDETQTLLLPRFSNVIQNIRPCFVTVLFVYRCIWSNMPAVD